MKTELREETRNFIGLLIFCHVESRLVIFFFCKTVNGFTGLLRSQIFSWLTLN